MSFFGNAKKMYDMQSKAKAAQKRLKNIPIVILKFLYIDYPAIGGDEPYSIYLSNLDFMQIIKDFQN